MTRHHSLNELAADKRTRVRVCEELVVRRIQLTCRKRLEVRVTDLHRPVIRVGVQRAAPDLFKPWQYLVVQDSLRPREVPCRNFAHLTSPVGRGSDACPVGTVVAVIPAREDMRETDNFTLAVSVDGLKARVQNQGPVRPHPEEADGEELLDLAGVVLVRDAAHRKIGFVVPQHIEIPTHRRRERGRFEEVAEIAEGSGVELVIEVGERLPAIVERTLGRHDVDLAEGEGDALAQLVRARDRVPPPGIKEERFVKLGATLDVGAPGPQDLWQRLRSRLRELILDPKLITAFSSARHDRLHGLDIGDTRSERRLRQEAGDSGIGVGIITPSRGLSRRNKGRCPFQLTEVSLDLTPREIHRVNVEI